MTTVSPSEIAYQQAHAAEFNADGLSAFCIAGEIIVVAAVALRFCSRKISGIALEADDWTLLVAMVLSLTAVILFDVRVYHEGFGRHFYSLSMPEREKFEKIDYVFNLFYTTGYPLSRISLVLLYRRVFVQQWFRNICWFFFACFSAYMVATVIIDSMLDYPVAAYWDPNITPKRTVNLVQLYMANAAFNIATDTMLLILPLTIIWRLSMSWQQKLGLTGVFSMGTLTLVASIARLVFFHQVSRDDISYTLIPIVWWTSAELFLGILCPCLVTFRPLFRATASYLSSHVTLSRSGKRGYEHTSDSKEAHSGGGGGGDGGASWPTKRELYETDVESSAIGTRGSSGGFNNFAKPVLVPAAAAARGESDRVALREDFAMSDFGGDPRVGGRRSRGKGDGMVEGPGGREREFGQAV